MAAKARGSASGALALSSTLTTALQAPIVWRSRTNRRVRSPPSTAESRAQRGALLERQRASQAATLAVASNRDTRDAGVAK